jgi:hypothetical protein
MTWVETSSCVSDESTRTQWSASTHRSDREKEIAVSDFPVLLQQTTNTTNGSSNNNGSGNSSGRGITRSSSSEDTNGYEPIGSEPVHDYNGRLPVLTETAVRESDEHSSNSEQLPLRIGAHAYHRVDEMYSDTSAAVHASDDSSSSSSINASSGQHDDVDHDIGSALLLHSNNNKHSSSSSSSTGQHQR